ncbi:unnamed protein product, partial [Meganyctiphanes norvegica]
SIMSGVIKNIRTLVTKYPLAKGMLTYSVLWPASNVTQQCLDPTRKKINHWETVRFAIFGPLVIAPSMYTWIKVASIMVKGNALRHAILKACLEQIFYAPVTITQFFIGMNLFEGKSWDESVQEWKVKGPSTWKTAICIWPIIQTVNFWLVPERNRVPLVAFCGFIWNIYLSYIHSRNWKENVIEEEAKNL